jgi:hypothetical protein
VPPSTSKWHPIKSFFSESWVLTIFSCRFNQCNRVGKFLKSGTDSTKVDALHSTQLTIVKSMFFASDFVCYSILAFTFTRTEKQPFPPLLESRCGSGVPI